MKEWKDKHGTIIQNGDIIKGPQSQHAPVVFVEEWNDLGVLLAIFITPLSEDWQQFYEIIGKGEPETIKKEETCQMEDMPEYKRDYGRSPQDIIDDIL